MVDDLLFITPEKRMKPTLPNYEQSGVLIVGDVMLDRYWGGPTNRISPEAPVPVVKVNNIEERPGGAANVAMNIAALGGNAHLVGLVGKIFHVINRHVNPPLQRSKLTPR